VDGVLWVHATSTQEFPTSSNFPTISRRTLFPHCTSHTDILGILKCLASAHKIQNSVNV
jgi:hypothetical protein